MLYTILSNLKFNGKTHATGEEIEMDEKNAKFLVEDGVLKAIEKPEKAPQKTEKKAEKKKRK